MIAVGIDLGGTKIEAQVFDSDWRVVARQRVPTPDVYGDLVRVVAAQIAWADAQADAELPIGIGAAGRVHPNTGHVLAANLCASGKPLPADIADAIGRQVTYLNDSHAFTLSEAVFGAGRGHHTVMALILGTGIGGGLSVGGDILMGPTQTGGEFGHMAAPAHLVVKHGVPLVACGCGRLGCIETLVAGQGFECISKTLTGQSAAPSQIAAARDSTMANVWAVWCDFAGDMLRNLILTVDPDVIVLGGGLSQIPDIAGALKQAALRAQIGDFGVPPIVIAEGGDTSGARGAGFAAWRAAQDA